MSSVTYHYVCVIFHKGNISLPLQSSFHKSVKSFPENRRIKMDYIILGRLTDNGNVKICLFD